MHTLTDDEPKRAPEHLLDEAPRDQVNIIASRSQAMLMTVPLGDGAPAPGAMQICPPSCTTAREPARAARQKSQALAAPSVAPR